MLTSTGISWAEGDKVEYSLDFSHLLSKPFPLPGQTLWADNHHHCQGGKVVYSLGFAHLPPIHFHCQGSRQGNNHNHC